MRSLYRGHLPTSPAQKVFVAGVAAVRALANPRRADMVATLSEVTGRVALEGMRNRMRMSDTGRQILEERPLISSDLKFDGPEHTFGGAYVKFMEKHGLSATERTPVALVDDDELAYVLLRYRQVHDFWHVLCGLPPTVLGELALKWFELVQTGLPMTALSAVFGPLRLNDAQRRKLATVYVPWALREGAASEHLLSVRYETKFDTDLVEFRKELNLSPAPPMKRR